MMGRRLGCSLAARRGRILHQLTRRERPRFRAGHRGGTSPLNSMAGLCATQSCLAEVCARTEPDRAPLERMPRKSLYFLEQRTHQARHILSYLLPKRSLYPLFQQQWVAVRNGVFLFHAKLCNHIAVIDRQTHFRIQHE